MTAADIQAIRDALAAGPTSGEWVAHAPSMIVRNTQRDYVASIQLDEEDREAQATMRYIAAVHPERIARLLAALEFATNDAERWRFIRRDHAWWMLKHFPAQQPYEDATEVIDEAIDAAMSPEGASD